MKLITRNALRKLITRNNLRKLIKIILIAAFLFVIFGIILIFVSPYCHSVVIKTKEYIYILRNNEARVSKYLGDDENVIIPDSFLGKPITSVEGLCFDGNETIESVEIPDTVKKIRFRAFYSCPNLASVKANNIVLVEHAAFADDKNLKHVDLGMHLETIEEYAFEYCESLEYIPSRESLKSIGTMAFAWSGITEVGDLTGVNIESEDIFQGTPWMDNQTGEYVTIGDVLIDYNGESDISVIPEGVKTIGEAYDIYPKRNISVYIPSTTTRIASYALLVSECYTLYIPKSVNSIIDNDDVYCLDYDLEEGGSCKIVTVSGSYAEQYAIDHGIDYEIVNGWEVPEEE